jgi:uncharacterized membrane-anchored protein YitT (DUF2179 family)
MIRDALAFAILIIVWLFAWVAVSDAAELLGPEERRLAATVAGGVIAAVVIGIVSSVGMRSGGNP